MTETFYLAIVLAPIWIMGIAVALEEIFK